MRRHQNISRLKAEPPAAYNNRGSAARSYLAPKSTGFERR
jgi:hypothetical protein